MIEDTARGLCRGAPLLVGVDVDVDVVVDVVADLPVHPVALLPVARGAAGHRLRLGHRHVVAGLHPRRDAHGRTALLRRQRGRPDEQDRRGRRTTQTAVVVVDPWPPFPSVGCTRF